MWNDAQIVEHIRMLSDMPRMQSYGHAISDLAQGCACAVDLGCGSGILTKMLLDAGVPKVQAIEYFPRTASLAKATLRPYGERATVIQGSSQEVDLTTLSPSLLVTETMGLIGPEENIVELMYDFAQRHPTIREWMPSRLRVLGCWVFSSALQRTVEQAKTSFSTAFPSMASENPMLDLYSSEIRSEIWNSDEVIALSEPFEITCYELGRTHDSSFHCECSRQTIPNQANCLHLYFEATLSEQITLSTSVHCDATHWGHSFVPMFGTSKDCDLTVSYRPGTGKVEVQWT